MIYMIRWLDKSGSQKAASIFFRYSLKRSNLKFIQVLFILNTRFPLANRARAYAIFDAMWIQVILANNCMFNVFVY